MRQVVVVGGGSFDLIVSQSPFNLDLDLDSLWTFGFALALDFRIWTLGLIMMYLI